MRKTPRSSVMLVKVLPVASWTAVTVTPGSTPPEESVTTPVMTASVWACASAGKSTIDTKSVPIHTIRFIKPPVGWPKLTYGWSAVNRPIGSIALVPRDHVEAGVSVRRLRFADPVKGGCRPLGQRVVRQEYSPRVQHPRDVHCAKRLLEHVVVNEDVGRNHEVEPLVVGQRIRTLQNDVQIARGDCLHNVRTYTHG